MLVGLQYKRYKTKQIGKMYITTRVINMWYLRFIVQKKWANKSEKKRRRKTLVQATGTEVLKEMNVSKLNDEKRKRKRATAARKAGISQETYSRRTNNMKEK